MPPSPRSRPARFIHLVLVLGLCLAAAPHVFAHLALDEQVKDLDARIAASPRDAGLYLRRGEVHRARGDLLPALRDFESARSLDAASAEPDFHAGGALLEAGLVLEAMPALDRALGIQPERSDIRMLRGRTLERLGRHLEASADFTLAIQSSARSGLPQPDLYLERAEALVSAGPRHLEKALAGLDEGILRIGPAVSLELAAIEIEVRLGRHDAALARLDAAAAGSRNQVQWLARRGEILLAAGRRPQARAAYEAALASLTTLPERRRSAGPIAALEVSVRDMLARLSKDDDAWRVGP